MKEDTAQTLANVLMGAAAIGAAVVILRTPSLRRLAFGLARTAIVTGIPAWLSREIKHAWEESRVPTPKAQEPTPDHQGASPKTQVSAASTPQRGVSSVGS